MVVFLFRMMSLGFFGGCYTIRIDVSFIFGNTSFIGGFGVEGKVK